MRNAKTAHGVIVVIAVVIVAAHVAPAAEVVANAVPSAEAVQAVSASLSLVVVASPVAEVLRDLVVAMIEVLHRLASKMKPRRCPRA